MIKPPAFTPPSQTIAPNLTPITSTPQSASSTMTVPPSIPTVSTDLFGGAITAHIPASFEDASNHRPVPDTQEVFVSRTYDTDISIIFDILQRVPGSDEDAIAVHWDDVASDPLRTHKLFDTRSVTLPNLYGTSERFPLHLFFC